MSAAAAEPVATEAPPKKSKKKLLVIVAAALVLCGGGAFFYMKQKAAAEAAAAEGEDGPASKGHAAAKHDAAPIYVPLDAFVVNLADKESDRFAQIGITLQVEDSKIADQLKTFMPAIRNGILMILAHKSSDELLERSGKEQLAAEILLAAARALGIQVSDAGAAPKKAAKAPADEDAAEEVAKEETTEEATEDEEEPKPKRAKKSKKDKAAVHNPITQVHFSNFIIQ